MRRHPALRQLSSEHHTGLVLARQARQAATGSAEEQRRAWEALVARFEAELEPHFRCEEEGLLVAMRRSGETSLVERTLAEHADLRALVAQNRGVSLARFAQLLTAHIRFEEQILFERAQELLDLDRLGGVSAPDG